jgi:hypothetical protein
MVVDEMQYAIYCDSAYVFVPDSRGLAIITTPSPLNTLLKIAYFLHVVTLEWDCGDVCTKWTLVDYKKVLKMHKMPVRDMYMTAMLLRDAFVTLNGCNTCEHFSCNAKSNSFLIEMGLLLFLLSWAPPLVLLPEKVQQLHLSPHSPAYRSNFSVQVLSTPLKRKGFQKFERVVIFSVF